MKIEVESWVSIQYMLERKNGQASKYARQQTHELRIKEGQTFEQAAECCWGDIKKITVGYKITFVKSERINIKVTEETQVLNWKP